MQLASAVHPSELLSKVVLKTAYVDDEKLLSYQGPLYAEISHHLAVRYRMYVMQRFK